MPPEKNMPLSNPESGRSREIIARAEQDARKFMEQNMREHLLKNEPLLTHDEKGDSPGVISVAESRLIKQMAQNDLNLSPEEITLYFMAFANIYKPQAVRDDNPEKT